MKMDHCFISLFGVNETWSGSGEDADVERYRYWVLDGAAWPWDWQVGDPVGEGGEAAVERGVG
jgi:hypothetical protein